MFGLVKDAHASEFYGELIAQAQSLPRLLGDHIHTTGRVQIMLLRP
jgi:hypothetical protein